MRAYLGTALLTLAAGLAAGGSARAGNIPSQSLGGVPASSMGKLGALVGSIFNGSLLRSTQPAPGPSVGPGYLNRFGVRHTTQGTGAASGLDYLKQFGLGRAR